MCSDPRRAVEVLPSRRAQVPPDLADGVHARLREYDFNCKTLHAFVPTNKL